MCYYGALPCCATSGHLHGENGETRSMCYYGALPLLCTFGAFAWRELRDKMFPSKVHPSSVGTRDREQEQGHPDVPTGHGPEAERSRTVPLGVQMSRHPFFFRRCRFFSPALGRE